MIELTEQPRRALTVTNAPQLLDPETGKTYVLVPSEVYERIASLLEDEPKVTGEMVDRLMEEEDRDDPHLGGLSAAVSDASIIPIACRS